MNKIDKMIQELCPNGVEYALLKDVCVDFIVPMRDRPKIFDGDIPWCRIEDKEGQFFNKSLSGLGVSQEIIDKMKLKVFPTGTVICSCSASIGAYAINTQPLITNQTFIGLVCGEKLYNKYLLYFMETQTKKLIQLATAGTIPYISRNKFEGLEIPIPPLTVQAEIVRILDNFTEFTAELNEKLTAELTARKKQYEYYKNQIFLKYIDIAKFVALNSIADVRDGTHDSPKPSNIGKYLITSKNVKNGIINFDGAYLISENDYNAINARSKVDKWDLLFTMIGTVGEVGLVCDEPDYAIKNVGLIKTGDELLSRFLKHYLTSKYVKTYVENNRSKGSQVFLALGKLRNLPVPSLTKLEQEEIVSILDRFDKLCNDISEGLPAEIATRQKQYEFYRDKLLTFKGFL